jgi:ATP:ADP antiporter, AAA family
MLGIILAGITSSYTLTKTVRDAFFLANLPASKLPYVFLAVGALTALASLFFSRFTWRRASWEGLAWISMVAALSLGVFSQLFRFQASWVPVAFYLWVNVYGLILVAEFWLFANSISNPREARRTFGPVGSAGIVGGLIGGLIAAPLARLWTLPSLLLVAAVLQGAVALLVKLRASHTASAEPVESVPARTIDAIRHPYVRWLALAALCSVMVTGVVDYLFKVQIQSRYPSSAQLASFLGLFYTATNLAAIALQWIGTGWMVRRFGAAWVSSLLPAGLTLGAGMIFAFPGFAAVTASRFWDQVARMSVSRSTGELFYFPLEPSLRRKAKALIGAGLERMGDGFAGLVILGAGAAMGASMFVLASVVAVLLALWVLAWLRIRAGYVAELGRNLRRLNLEGHKVKISLREASLLHEMERLLASPYERIVIQGIELLEENSPEMVESALGTLLGHVSPRVRARALRFLRTHPASELVPRVTELVQDEDPEVQIEALSTLGVLQGTDPFDSVEEYLQSPVEGIRKAAVLAVTENAPRESEARLRDTLVTLLRQGGVLDRITVAEALGRRPGPSDLHDLLTPLLTDSELAVRRAALRSAGRAQRRTHVPLLIDALAARATEDDARFGLVTLGDRVVGTLGDYLSDPTVPQPIRHAIPRALGEIHTQSSIEALFRCRERQDVRLAFRVLKASNRIRASGAEVVFPRVTVTEDVEYDVRGHLFALVHYRSCPIGRGRSAERLLCVALNERMEHALDRVFRRLTLLYPVTDLVAAYQGVRSSDPRLRGNAIEYLENALAPDHRRLVLPLVDDSGDAARLRLAEQLYGFRPGRFEDTLTSLLQSDDAWLRACALYVVGSRKEQELMPLVEKNLAALNALVRETASWARLALATPAVS